MNTSAFKKEKKSTDLADSAISWNLPPQFELNELEQKFHTAILKRQADDKPITIQKSINSEAMIFIVNHLRASVNEAKSFRELLLVSINQGNKKFIVDLSNCQFIDSTYLGAIILMLKKINSEGGYLSLVANPQKLKILHAFQELHKILKVHSSIEEAIENMKKD